MTSMLPRGRGLGVKTSAKKSIRRGSSLIKGALNKVTSPFGIRI